ncbi:MAG TPA: DNA-processing protein DprA [Usitatibacteraceae bacterium]|nr:DNA-processing protein DprA [Usitatibacteraceae bacterium]
MRSDAIEWLRLCLVPGIPGAAQRALLKAFGTPGAAAGADRSSLAAVVDETVADAMVAGPPAELLTATLAWLEHPGHSLLALGDNEYPRDLLQIQDPPTILYAIGDTGLLNRPALAIVGSRNASRQGAIDAREFARSLSDAGFGIASGLALGIDAAAHRGGLAGRSSTLAVVGTGLDRVYPARNRDLAHEIAARGVLVSEFPLGTPPVAANFPRRNRIISGLSRGVLVVEAAMKSGSLTTARLALDQGRDAFAIPGSIHSPLSKGCHWLIKQGAKLVESADDVLAELDGRPQAPTGLEGPDVGRIEQEPLLEALGYSPASLDALALRTGSPAPELAADLTLLELEGRVERLPGGLYRQLVVP